MNFRNSTLRTEHQVCVPRLSGIHKKYCLLSFSPSFILFFLLRFPLFFYRISFHSSWLSHFTTRNILSSSEHHTTRNVVSSSEYLTTRNCCSVFRTSYYQKLLLRPVRNLQNILLPEIVNTVHHQLLLYYSILLHFNRYC